MRLDLSYLEDIYQAAKDAHEFVSGFSFETFAADRKTRRAVINCLHEIGEASKKLSKDYKRQHPQIPWEQLTSHRNELAHEYFRIDYGQVWQITQDILPSLIEYLETLLPPNLEL
jgi:uncharacterized protein with HEPN domain